MQNMNHSEGDIFILHSIPVQVIENRDQIPETYQLLSKAVGKAFRARGINEYGMIELWIADDGTDTPDACANSVWIEPEFLAGSVDSGSAVTDL
jgi:hypothetical protein